MTEDQYLSMILAEYDKVEDDAEDPRDEYDADKEEISDKFKELGVDVDIQLSYKEKEQ